MSLRQDASGRAILMPSIRSTYDDSFSLPKLNEATPAYQTFAVPSALSLGAVPTTQVITLREQSPRLDQLEGRLAAHEQRTATLLDRATRIKHDAVDAIGVAQGTWQQERRARELLQEHIRSITALVGQLHNDVAAIASQLQGRDMALVQNDHAVKAIEMQYQSVITDLR